MFSNLFASPKTARLSPGTLTLEIDGQDVAISIRHNPRARRYILRLPQSGMVPVLTIPGNGNHDEAMDFALRHTGWLAARLARKAEPTSLSPGAVIPLRGVDHGIVATGGLRGTIRPAQGDTMPVLHVPGDIEHLERRLTDWLKREARADLTKACTHHANILGLHFRSITIRDQRTRWGSCSSGGRLNFSWRLILAPPEILDYVAAHEVAHLQEMNHQPQFWRLVAKTCPDMARHRAWLRKNGHRLNGFGR